jgi:hypothetical protein
VNVERPEYFLDFLTVNVPNDVDSELVMVDDHHPLVQYTRRWVVEGSSTYDYNGTTHRPNTTGATASFTFTGTSIEVYGTVKHNSSDSPTIAAFHIDDGETNYFNAINTGGEYVPKTQLYAKNVSYGQHTLHVEAKAASEFWLDYFIYDSSTPQSTPSSPPSSSPSNKPSTSSIVGGVIGGVFGLLILAFLIFFLFRRRRRSQNLEENFDLGGPTDLGFHKYADGLASSPLLRPLGSRNNSSHPLPPIDDQGANTLSALHIEPYNIEPSEGSKQNGGNVKQRVAGPLPQKYRGQQARSVAEASEYEQSNSSTYTSSEWNDLRSPPPYSNSSR